MNVARLSVFEKNRADGFTLVELLVVIATVGILALLLLPALAGTKPNSQSFQCLENERQLVLACQMYAEDNNDLLPPNDYPFTTQYTLNSGGATWQSKHRNWVVGSMSPTCPLDQSDALASLGKSYLLDPNTVLSPYQTNRAIYHCPADNYISPNSHRAHTRSYSMNSAVGTIFASAVQNDNTDSLHRNIGAPVTGGWLPGNAFNGSQTTWLTYGRMSSFSRPGPANTFIIIEENPFSMNDASIAIPAAAAPGSTYLIDFPASYHNAATAISFADGHVLIHKWQDVRTYTPANTQGAQNPDDPDCFYLASITSALR